MSKSWFFLLSAAIGLLGLFLFFNHAVYSITFLHPGWTKMLDHSSPSENALNDWEKISSTLQHFAAIIALILGAIVAYFKFVRGRVYRPRIEPSIAGRVEKTGGCKFLVISSEVKNVGASKISLGPSSGLDIFFDDTKNMPRTGEQLPIETVKWKEPVSFRVFQDHEWIESGETIREEKMFALSGQDLVAVKIAIQLAVGKITATAMKIFVLEEESSKPT